MRREKNINSFMIISMVIVAISIILFISFFVSNASKRKEQNKFVGEISNLKDDTENLEDVSTQIGKSVEESMDEQEFEMAELVEDNTISDEVQTNKTAETQETKLKNTEENIENKTTQTNAKEINDKNKNNIDLQAPIKGEILREFAKDSLVYSSTLQEWITHNGVDIKADKTTVVKSAANGTVSAIKKDPRYGLTVIINHDNGYQTIYSNLLTTEFVIKGEKVEKGQSIGTVGNSAAFEISDDYHLHFELLRNGEYLDPDIDIDFE